MVCTLWLKSVPHVSELNRVYLVQWGFPVAQRLKRLPPMRETQFQSLGREDPLEKDMVPTPVFLPGESHGRRSLVVYSPRGRKESDMKFIQGIFK